MDDIGFWIALLVVFLLWYPFARGRPPVTRFLEHLTFWRWVIYSIVTIGAAYIAYVPISVMMDNPIGSLAWWLALLSVVAITLLFWVAHWRLRLLPSRKK